MTKEDFFARYEIDLTAGRLGGGAFGTVYKAYDNILDSWKAIKIAEVRYFEGKEFSLISEYNATSNLARHKNIANYQAVFQFQMPNGLFDYAIMQYYNEGNLKQLLSNKTLQPHQLKDIGLGLIKGVRFLHKHKVIHRDLKPSNILISKKGEDYIPKIADFGLAKSVSAEALSAFTNSFGGGTLEYSSPEQLLGHKLKYNSDLWSLGVILFELFIGKIPFESESKIGSPEARRRAIYQNIVNEPTPSSVSMCPAPFDYIITSCLTKNPDDRISTAEQIVDYLNEFNPSKSYQEDQTTIFGNVNTIAKLKEEERLKELKTQEDILKAEQKRIDEERQRYLEEQRLREQKEQRVLQEERRAEEERKLEEQRIAEEQQKAEEKRIEGERLAEEQRIAQEKQNAEEKRIAEEQRIAEEKRRHELEQERLNNEKRIEEERRVEIERQEKQRLLDEKEAKEKEAARIAKAEDEENKRKADEEKLRIEKVKKEQKRLKEAEEQKQRAVALALQKEVKLKEKEAKLKKKQEELNYQKKLREEEKREKAENKRLKEEQRAKEKQLKREKALISLDNTPDPEETKSKSKRWLIILISLLIGGAAVTTYKYFDGNSNNRNAIVESFPITSEPNLDKLKAYLEKETDPVQKIAIQKRIKEVVVINDNDAWQTAKKTNSLEGYQAYKDAYPEGIHKIEAVEEIDRILSTVEEQSEEEFWKVIIQSDNESAYQKYLNKYPSGKYKSDANKALDRIASEKESAIWNAIVKNDLISDYEKYLIDYPKGKYTTKAKGKIKDKKNRIISAQWQSIRSSQDLTILDKFISNHPDSPEADIARKRIFELKKPNTHTKGTEKVSLVTMDPNWSRIKSGNNIDSIGRYILENPDSPHKAEATALFDDLFWNKIQKTKFIRDYQEYLDMFPTGKHTKEARRMVKVIGPLVKGYLEQENNIKGGNFDLGCRWEIKDCQKDEIPSKSVKIKDFYLSKYEVTQREYQKVMGTNPSYFNDCPSCPVENVSWNDAQAFIAKLNRDTDNIFKFRLPTEAEWEYAASGGSRYAYAGSDDIDKIAVYKSNSGGTAKRGSKKANKFKLYDLTGNVAEWCSDSYDEGAYSKSTPLSGNNKVLRGGSWKDRSKKCRIKDRHFAPKDYKDETIGFRLARG